MNGKERLIDFQRDQNQAEGWKYRIIKIEPVPEVYVLRFQRG